MFGRLGFGTLADSVAAAFAVETATGIFAYLEVNFALSSVVLEKHFACALPCLKKTCHEYQPKVEKVLLLEQMVGPFGGQMLRPFVRRLVRALLATDIWFETVVDELEKLFPHSLETGPAHMSGQRGEGGCNACYCILFYVLHGSRQLDEATDIHCA